MSDFNDAAAFVDALAAEHYPTDIFLPLPPEFDWALLDRWLSDTFGFRRLRDASDGGES